MIYIKRGIFFCAVAMAALYAPGAAAHPAGFSWEKTSGAYVMDVGYDTDTFIAGEYVRFDFALKDASTKDPRDFVQAWIRVMDKEGKRTLLATGVYRQPVGPTTMLYFFHQPGAYTLDVSFRDATGEDLAVGSFPLEVVSADSADFWWTLAGAILALLGSAGAGYWAGAIRRRHPTV